MKTKEKKLINQLKVSSIKLLVNNQIPRKLVLEINKLNDNSSESEVRLLSQLSEHYLRVKGYYKKYPIMHDMANKEIVDAITQFANKGKEF